ncbi:MAG: hypothetical protein N2749_02060 [Clostridia bacterium]|nr:hypothetical protein [Clostridia bacterium]
MDKLWILFKTTFIDNYNINKLFSSKNKLKLVGMIFLVLFIIGYLGFVSAIYAKMALDFFSKYNMQYMTLTIFAIMVSMSIFVLGINKSKAILFNSKDSEILFSMPIKQSTIMANKIINFMIINYVPVVLVMLPAFVVYSIYVPVQVTYYIYSLLILLFLPVIPTILACIIGYAIAYITSKSKRKSLAEILVSFIFIGIIMYMSVNIQKIGKTLVENNVDFEKAMKIFLYPIYSMQKTIVEYNLISMLMFILINILAFAIFILVFNSFYRKILLRLGTSWTKNKYVEKTLNSSSVDMALLKKELRNYFSIPIYVLNTIFGVVLLLVLAIASIFYDKGVIYSVLELDPTMLSVYQMLILLIAFVVAMTSSTSSSISLEGDNLWIIKSMPVSQRQIFRSKILVNILIVMPVTIVSIILLAMQFNITIMQTFKLILFSFLLNLLVSQFGIIANLKYPKLKFKSPVQVVKQGLSAFIAIFGMMIFLALSAFTYFQVKSVMSFDNFILCLMGAYAIIVGIQHLVICKWGVERFKKI